MEVRTSETSHGPNQPVSRTDNIQTVITNIEPTTDLPFSLKSKYPLPSFQRNFERLVIFKL